MVAYYQFYNISNIYLRIIDLSIMDYVSPQIYTNKLPSWGNLLQTIPQIALCQDFLAFHFRSPKTPNSTLIAMTYLWIASLLGNGIPTNLAPNSHVRVTSYDPNVFAKKTIANPCCGVSFDCLWGRAFLFPHVEMVGSSHLEPSVQNLGVTSSNEHIVATFFKKSIQVRWDHLLIRKEWRFQRLWLPIDILDWSQVKPVYTNAGGVFNILQHLYI